MSIVALDGLHIGELEIRRTKSPVELLDIVPLYMGAFPFTERRTVESMSQALSLDIVYFYRIFLKDKCIGMMHFWILRFAQSGQGSSLIAYRVGKPRETASHRGRTA